MSRDGTFTIGWWGQIEMRRRHMNESILFELLVVLFFFPICVGKILFWQLKKGIPTYHFYDYIAYFIYLVYCLIIHPHHNMNFTKAGVVGRVFFAAVSLLPSRIIGISWVFNNIYWVNNWINARLIMEYLKTPSKRKEERKISISVTPLVTFLCVPWRIICFYYSLL